MSLLLFFCQNIPGLKNCKLVFLTFKIPWYEGLRWWVLVFRCIHVIIDIRINICISKRPMTTTFGKQVHEQDLIQMKLMKQVLVKSSHQDHMTKQKYFTSTIGVSMPIATKFDKIPRIKTLRLLIIWQTKTIIYSLPLRLWHKT